MAKPPKDDSFIDLTLDHEGKSTFKFIKELDVRTKAFKRMFVWAMANDLFEMISEKIPKGRKYDRLIKALKVGQGPGGSFAVFIDNKAKGIKKVDSPVTLIYVKARRIQDRVKPEIKLLQDYSPWTVDTIPFWPDRKQALIVQRRVDKKMVDKIAKLKSGQKDKIHRQLVALGQKDTDNAMAKRTKDMRKAKAIPDVAFEMLTLEFGGGTERGTAIWRNSLKELFPGKAKTVLKRYKQIQYAIGDSRNNSWRNWPRVNVKVKTAQLSSFVKFQKQLGY